MSRRSERAAVACLLAIFFGLSLSSVWHKTLTADEPFHHRYGRQILGFDATRFDNSKMPVSAWNAIPCRVGESLGGSFPDGGDGIGRLLCHRTSARLMTTLVALMLGAYIHRWSRLLYGPRAGLLSLTLFAFSPNLIAHGRLVTTDLYAATAATVASYHFWRFVELGGRGRGLASAVALGAAQLAKYSMVWLYPIFLATLAVRASVVSGRGTEATISRPPDWKRWARPALGFALASSLTINIGFLWDRVFVPFDDYAFRSDAFQALQRSAGQMGRLPVPLAYPFLEGLDWVKQSDDDGNTSGNAYLLGEVRDKRDPRGAFGGYFLIASLFKAPLATQMLFAWALVMLVRRFSARDFVRRELYLLMPCLVYGVYFNLFLESQLGIRLFLIVFPFALVLCGRVLARPPEAGHSRLFAVSGLAAWTVVSVLSYFPHYLSYFNELVPDRKMAYKVLADSNLSWGQDIEYLRAYVREHPDVVVRPRQPMAGRLVVDVNRLTGVFQRRRLAWLRDNFEPVDRIAGSYLVFDVTPDALEKALAKGDDP